MRTSLLTLALLAADATASIPYYYTQPKLVLHSDVIVVARCRETRKLDHGGAIHSVEVREVIANWSGITDFRGFELHDAIPCTVIGARAIVPSDEDLLLFVRVSGKRFVIPYACCNAVVPLAGTAQVWRPADRAIEKTPARRFVERVRAQVRQFLDASWLGRAIEGAVGSGHPFNASDRGHLENRLRWLERAVERTHRGWDAADGIARSIEGDRPVFRGTGAVTRALEAGAVDLALTWEGELSVEVRAAGRTVFTKRFEKDGAWSHTLDVPDGATLRVHVRGRVRVDRP